LSGALDGLDAFLEPPVPPGGLLKNFRVSKDHSKQVVEVVGDSSGQPANGLYLLGLQELSF